MEFNAVKSIKILVFKGLSLKILSLVILTLFSVHLSASKNTLPPLAQEQLNKIGGKLTVDFVLAQEGF